METFELDKEVSTAQLAAEIAAAHGWEDVPAVSVRQPGQQDDEGDVLPGMVAVDADADDDTVRDVIDAHAPQTLAPVAARERLAELYEKGWGNLTDSERAEITQHTLTILGS